MVHETPEVFGDLLSNVEIISREISAITHGERTSIDFALFPWAITSRIGRAVKNEKGSEFKIENRMKAGGSLFIFARQSIRHPGSKKQSNCYLEYGFKLDIDKGEKDGSPYIYASVEWKSPIRGEGWLLEDCYVKVPCYTLGNRSKATSKTVNQIEKAILKASSTGVSDFQKTALNTLLLAIRK